MPMEEKMTNKALKKNDGSSTKELKGHKKNEQKKNYDKWPPFA
jgi:hypothetical protein